KAYPELISLSSPTRRISGHISEKFNKYSHSVHMGSLTDVFDFDGVMDFDKKIKSEFPDATYVTECKIDGLSVSLEYIDGVFVRGATRGNGYIGEDVTQNLLTIRSIPLVLTEKVKRLIVRGEVYMPKKIFAMLNEKREDDGLMSFANPRNAAAGSLRQLDSSLCAERRLDIFVFNVQLCEENAPKYHSDSLEWLQKLGFVVSPKFLRCKTCDEIIEKIKSIGETRSSLEYDIDGAVVKVDSLEMRRELGEVGAVPKWAVAYKYPPETAKTEVLDIEIQVGRT
ncbi:MAG: NAD-dependent DNA ligase LigA, partial [Clostridia bacterium]